jgi:hypothetical protein
MTTRRVILSAALAAAFAVPASAADMPGTYAPPVQAAAPAECTLGARHRQPDKVYLPPQPAYIVAERCGQTAYWLDTVMAAPRHEKILVYYNGGSMDRTDVTMLVVPPWYSRPH